MAAVDEPGSSGFVMRPGRQRADTGFRSGACACKRRRRLRTRWRPRAAACHRLPRMRPATATRISTLAIGAFQPYLTERPGSSLGPGGCGCVEHLFRSDGVRPADSIRAAGPGGDWAVCLGTAHVRGRVLLLSHAGMGRGGAERSGHVGCAGVAQALGNRPSRAPADCSSPPVRGQPLSERCGAGSGSAAP
jgi:hypothetical protein